ncbi:MAG: M24 family metallopeptidase [bacterium]
MTPFDEPRLFALMEDQGLDLLVLNSRHNVRYVTGGYYFHLHAAYLPTGTTQYLPFVGIPRGRADAAFIVGFRGEDRVWDAERVWIQQRFGTARDTVKAAETLVEVLQKLGLSRGRIGIELSMLPADAYLTLVRGLPGASLVDASSVMAELRAVKTGQEIALMRKLYYRAASAIQASFAACRAGMTTADIARIVHWELESRGLNFLWVYTAAGPGFLRAPSTATWDPGHVLHIDAASEHDDYVTDLCRMGCLGAPAPLAADLHAECLAIQDRLRALVRPGITCGEVYAATQDAIRRTKFSQYARCVVHGIGMVPAEYPLIVPDSPRLLTAGNVLSIETDFLHPECGHVKIEDAVAVTQNGNEGLGELGREWQIV